MIITDKRTSGFKIKRHFAFFPRIVVDLKDNQEIWFQSYYKIYYFNRYFGYIEYYIDHLYYRGAAEFSTREAAEAYLRTKE